MSTHLQRREFLRRLSAAGAAVTTAGIVGLPAAAKEDKPTRQTQEISDDRFILTEKQAEAINLLKAAALRAPDSAEIVHRVGRTLMDVNGESEAVPLLMRAAKLNPCFTDAWYDLGVTLSRLKQRKRARACFLKALRLDPKYAWAYYDLACLDALEGKPNAACENLHNAVARGFRDVGYLLRDADLLSLRRDARWKEIVVRHHRGESRGIRQELTRQQARPVSSS